MNQTEAAERQSMLAVADAYAAEHYRWNFWINVTEGATFWFANSFFSVVTIAPLFLSKLTDNTLAFGWIALVGQAGWYIPQLLTANWVEGLAQKKPVVVNVGFFAERVPLFVAVLAAALAGWRLEVALGLFLVAYTWRELGAGLVAISWQDLIARVIPVERRGRMLGLTFFLGAGMGVIGAQMSSWLLDRYAFPLNFVMIFGIGAVGILVSWLVLLLVREPRYPPVIERTTHRVYVASLWQLLQQDQNFRRYLVARALLALGTLANGFVTFVAISRWQVPDAMVGGYTALFLIGQTLGNLQVTVFADRHGHRLMLQLAGLASLAAFVAALFAPGPEWFFLVFALVGYNYGVAIVSGILLVMEFGAPERRPTYIGLGNTVVGVSMGVAPLVGTALLNVDAAWLFGAAVVVNLAAVAMLRWGVRSPRAMVATSKV